MYTGRRGHLIMVRVHVELITRLAPGEQVLGQRYRLRTHTVFFAVRRNAWRHLALVYATLRGGGIDLLGRLFESQLVAKLTVTYLLLSKLTL